MELSDYFMANIQTPSYTTTTTTNGLSNSNNSNNSTNIDTVIILDSDHGICVVNPDILISGTTVGGAFPCSRRAVLNDRFDLPSLHLFKIWMILLRYLVQ